MNNVMKLKRAISNTRYRDYPDRYFKPILNLTWDFWHQDYDVQIAVVRRSEFMHAFLLAVVAQTSFFNRDDDYYYPRIDEALGDPEAAIDLFDDAMRCYVPRMPDKRLTRTLFKRVHTARVSK